MKKSTTPSYRVVYAVSASWTSHLPGILESGDPTGSGPVSVEQCTSTYAEAVALANRLVHLTTGLPCPVFHTGDMDPGILQVLWSNRSNTHTCNITRTGVPFAGTCPIRDISHRTGRDSGQAQDAV